MPGASMTRVASQQRHLVGPQGNLIGLGSGVLVLERLGREGSKRDGSLGEQSLLLGKPLLGACLSFLCTLRRWPASPQPLGM